MFGVDNPFLLALIFVAIAIWTVALISAVRARRRLWEVAGLSKPLWIGMLIAANLVQRFLPYAALGLVTAAAGCAYFLIAKRRLVAVDELRMERHTEILGEVAEEFRRNDQGGL